MALADEIAWFNQSRATIVQQYGGQWVLVKNQGVRGAFKTYALAFEAGVKQFGPTGGFLVKQALMHDPKEATV